MSALIENTPEPMRAMCKDDGDKDKGSHQEQESEGDSPEGEANDSDAMADTEDQAAIKPIKTIHELFQYDCDKAVPHLATIRAQTKPLSPAFSTRYKMKIDGSPCSALGDSKLLVCHDFKGGYGHDKYIHGTCEPENYTFHHWLQTDIFVYFSHKFITIPPIGWINAAHSHGVKILGTIITEWDEGKLICKELFKNSEQIDVAVDKLCQINNDFMFDGYLVNIENPVEDVGLMLEFIEKLTKRLHGSSPKNEVIYYDSVITSGKLKWQNELNNLNKPFFDVCDGIFLNYGWRASNLETSIQTAGERCFDVYVGIDVFGRGCAAFGGLYTADALGEIENTKKLSTAIFAPGWTFETQPYKHFPLIDNELWGKCFPNFRYKCLTMDEKTNSSMINGTRDGAEMTCLKTSIIATDFSRGFGKRCFKQFQHPDTQPWFNLCQQSLQPIMYSWNEKLEPRLGPYETVSTRWTFYDTDAGFQGGGCLTCPDFYAESLTEVLYKICFPLDIPLRARVGADINNDDENRAESEYIVVLCAWKQSQSASGMRSVKDAVRHGQSETPVIGFTFRKNSTSAENQDQCQKAKIVPVQEISEVRKGDPDHLKPSITFQLDDLVDSCDGQNDSSATRFHFSFSFDENGHCNRRVVASGWNFSCQLLLVDDLLKFGPELQAVFIGNCEGLSIGYFSMSHVKEE